MEFARAKDGKVGVWFDKINVYVCVTGAKLKSSEVTIDKSLVAYELHDTLSRVTLSLVPDALFHLMR